MRLGLQKTVITITICLSINIAYAQQQQNTAAEFEAYGSSLNRSLGEMLEAKNYQAVVKGLEAYQARFEQLPAGIKARFASNMPEIYYNLASYYALLDQKEMAISNFERAASAGYANYQHMASDINLDPLRSDPTFIAAAQKIRVRGDYGYILKQSGKYVRSSRKGLPEFSYQNAADPVLAGLRSQFNLDSVAGDGSETSRFKNLLNWAHNVVTHDGNASNPVQRNAADLIAICKKENRGINCRMMATILRDAYQAMGYPSRLVTCMPKDTADVDCHVINAVWSVTMKKWLWMDPTFNAYVSSGNGSLLSIAEVRENLIAGKKLILNKEANWNNLVKQTKEDYLNHYMSKNLYLIQCSTKSEWNLETRGQGKKVDYINLYPSDFSSIRAKKITSKDGSQLATNDPAYFWQAPRKHSKKS